VDTTVKNHPGARLTAVLAHLGLAASSWYRRATEPSQRQRPGPKPTSLPSEIVGAVVAMATENPWYGDVSPCGAGRDEPSGLSCDEGPRPPAQTPAYLARALPGGEALRTASAAAQRLVADGRDVRPHRGRRVVVRDHRDQLLAAHFTSSYCAAEAVAALALARAEAERLHGPLERRPFLVTDNGTSFKAKRFVVHLAGAYAHVRIAYRTPTQLGLLERFHSDPQRGGTLLAALRRPRDPRRGATRGHRRRSTSAGGGSGYRSGKAGPRGPRPSSTPCWLLKSGGPCHELRVPAEPKIPPGAVRLCVVVKVDHAAQSAQGYSPQAAKEFAREREKRQATRGQKDSHKTRPGNST